MEALSHLRRMIASLDEALVDALGARSRLGFDPAFYALPADALPGLNELAGAFADSATPAGRVRVLRPAFLAGMLPGLCAGAPDNGPAPCLAADAACLDALARRLALSVHVATRKREAVPEGLQAALNIGVVTGRLPTKGLPLPDLARALTDLTEKAREVNRARAEQRAEADGIVADRAEERVYARARAAVIRRLDKGGVVSRKSIRTSMRSELKRHLDSTLDDLISEGIVGERAGGYEMT